MNWMIALGAVFVVSGIAGLMIAQIFLYKWIKKFNEEWMNER